MSSPIRVTGLALLLVFASSLPPRLARAEEPIAADEDHVRRGVGLRSVGKNREALSEFEAADALRSTPRTRAQIALAHQALGDWVGAETGLEGALREPSDPWIAQYRDALESALDVVRQHVASLVVEADVDGAELFVGARRVGLLPLRAPVRVAREIVTIEVHAPGHLPSRRAVDLTAAPESRVLVTLAPDPPASAPQVSDPLASRAMSPAAQRTGGRGELRTAGILSLTGAGVLATAGIIAWRARVNAIDAYDSDSTCVLGDLTREQRCGSYRATSNAALAIEVGAFAAAGTAALVGVTLLAAPRGRPSYRIGCAFGPAPGISCRGEF